MKKDKNRSRSRRRGRRRQVAAVPVNKVPQQLDLFEHPEFVIRYSKPEIEAFRAAALKLMDRGDKAPRQTYLEVKVTVAEEARRFEPRLFAAMGRLGFRPVGVDRWKQDIVTSTCMSACDDVLSAWNLAIVVRALKAGIGSDDLDVDISWGFGKWECRCEDDEDEELAA